MIEKHASAVLEAGAMLGEGPVWDSGRDLLYFVDITGCRIHSLDPQSGDHQTMPLPEQVGALAIEPDGHLLVALAKRIVRFDPGSGDMVDVCEVEPDLPNNRCNDGKRDPAGRFWIGTMASAGDDRKGAGALYRLDDSSLTKVIDSVTISNGLGWAADLRTMYFIDSPTREVWAFDFDPVDSSIANRRTVVRTPEDWGVPDGMCVGPDDSLYVAQWGAGCIGRWDPSTGELIERILTGCPHTTSCCFGPAGDLYITTAQLGLSASGLAGAPLSGSLFCFQN